MPPTSALPQRQASAVAPVPPPLPERRLKPAISGQRVAPHIVWINPHVNRPPSTDMPSPFSGHRPKPLRALLGVFSGRNAPVASAAQEMGVPCFQPFDMRRDISLDILDDQIFQSLLTLCWSGKVDLLCLAPPCGPYSLCRLKPGGPPPLRTHAYLNGLPGLNSRQCEEVKTSQEIHSRAHQLATAGATMGGSFVLEQPPTSLAWLEPSAQQLLRAFNATIAWVDSCEFGLMLQKSWAFASNDPRISQLAARCTHQAKHPKFVGKRTHDGAFASASSAQYPQPLAAALVRTFCNAWPRGPQDFMPLPFNGQPAQPAVLPRGSRAPVCDGAGWYSSADWTHPQGVNALTAFSERMQRYLLAHDLPRQIAASIASGRPDHPIPPEHHQNLLKACLQEAYSEKLDKTQVGQPFRLNLMQFFAKALDDPDFALLEILKEGAPTGVFEALPSSHQWPHVPDAHPLRLPLEACQGNWKPAEAEPDLTQSLIDSEIANGWVELFQGSEADARLAWPQGIAVGKLNVVTAEGKDPRLVLDSTVCQVNPSCCLPEKVVLPSAADVRSAFQPEDAHGLWLGASLDVKAAHKRVMVKASDRGLLLFRFQGKLYYYKVCHFGARFSAYWWQRLGGVLVRLLHGFMAAQPHRLWLYVDDLLANLHRPVILKPICLNGCLPDHPPSPHFLEKGLPWRWPRLVRLEV